MPATFLSSSSFYCHIYGVSTSIGVHDAKAETIQEIEQGLLWFLIYTISINYTHALAFFVRFFVFYLCSRLLHFISSFHFCQKSDGSEMLSTSRRRNHTWWWRRWWWRRALCCGLETLQMPRARMLETIFDQKVSQAKYSIVTYGSSYFWTFDHCLHFFLNIILQVHNPKSLMEIRIQSLPAVSLK